MKVCSVCSRKIENEEPAILAMSAYGNPRYLCDGCAHEVDTALYSRNPEEIEKAIEDLGEKISESPTADSASFESLYKLLSIAGERLKRIKDGTYDFSLDEKITDFQDDGIAEIPPELQETEEDRKLDERDAENQKKFDKITNWVSLAVIVAIVVFFIIKFFG